MALHDCSNRRQTCCLGSSPALRHARCGG
ncbi:hypothetical protein GFM13_20750 [Rhizobium leguminosarum bv. viciae]|nr:hypothetical protein [Rhizobium leguminosarum bv. viciae]